jgi:hypothetical protein
MKRKIEDQLRAEYFQLLPEIRLVVEILEAEVRYLVIPILMRLRAHERLIIESRVKECESAVDALRRDQEGGVFDEEKSDSYTLTELNDLAGVRILVFPRSLVSSVDKALQTRFSTWTADPVLGYSDEEMPLALKYHGYCKSSSKVKGEFQIVPMLTGLFWKVEHSAIYKPTPKLKGIARSLAMRQRTQEVLDALRMFEEEFEDLLRKQESK